MAGLSERVITQISRYGMFSAGQRVGAAVSGGADSMCLLHLLRELAPRWNLHLSVVHVEHGIRGQTSRQDAAFVQREAGELGFRFHLYKADVPALGGNLEQAARQVRHGFYRELIASGQVDRIATGHTCSDQAETVLYRILRGAGIAGLSGIRPVAENGLVRPLLSLWRAEIEAWLRERNITWREDLSNQDLTFARNRLRHETLPMLREGFNPNLDQTLAQLAILAQDEEIFWNQTADRSAVGEGTVGGPIVLLAASLAESPAALARRQIRRAIQRVKGDLRQIEFGHTEAVLQMAQPNQGHSRVQLPGIDVIRSFEWIRIARGTCFSLSPGELKRDFEIIVNVPGSATLPGGHVVTFELIEPKGATESYDRVKDEIDWQRLLSISALGAAGNTGARSCRMELRNWRPGDRYHPAGQSHDEKIKTLFQEGRIPLWERRHWPVVTLDGRIVWTRRFGVAASLSAEPGCTQTLEIRESSSV
ncbi:MAG: tRNA lysidine(34) synthetase TilS [Bryobacteraceae bacterium]